ncbi:MAG: ABC transporter permease [Lachnospiraceae bacterium]
MEKKYKQNVSPGQRKYLRKHRKKQIIILIFRILILIIFVGGWEALTRLKIIDSFIFSSPSRIIKAATTYFTNGTLAYHIRITLIETFVCFSIVIAGGLTAAVLLWWNDTLYKIFEPYLVILNSLPKSALAPVFIVWLGTGMKTIIVAAISVAIFGAIMSFYEHFRQTDPDKIKLIYTLGGNKLSVLTKLVIPSNKAYIINVMKVNMGLSLVGVIIGEFVAANAGLGYLILYASQVFKLDLVLLSITILCFMAAILYLALDLLEKFCLRRD